MLKRPLYAVWRIRAGKRYVIYATTVASDRWAIAKEIWIARRVLQLFLNGEYAGMHEDRVVVSRYLRSNTESTARASSKSKHRGR